jgi:hypothetical protein
MAIGGVISGLHHARAVNFAFLSCTQCKNHRHQFQSEKHWLSEKPKITQAGHPENLLFRTKTSKNLRCPCKQTFQFKPCVTDDE